MRRRWRCAGRSAITAGSGVAEVRASDLPWLSVIVPALNESGQIRQTLGELQALREQGAEVIVVDGGYGGANGMAYLRQHGVLTQDVVGPRDPRVA